MCPRAYRMDKRQAARDLTRARILDAVRQLLADDSTRDLSMEAVARRADVSRLTIYYQFGSRAGLLEALFDHLAARGNMQRLAAVFQAPTPSVAVDRMVSTFVGFWSADPSVMRRLRAMAVLDGEINQGVRARDARRAQIAREILKRTGQTKRLDAHQAQAADILSMLTSFETYDALAQGGQTYDQIVANVGALARSALARLLPTTPMPRARSDEARQRKPPV
jgi:AcrR family transcriptional regulator